MTRNVYGGIFIILFISALEASEDSCSYWKLSGGSNWYEGIVEVWYNQTWANICADSFNKTDAEEVCTKIFDGKGIPDKQFPYESNVYGAVLQNSSIFYKMCGMGGYIHGRQCSKVASLCCYDSSKESCSNNWASTVEAGGDLSRKYKEHLQYDQLLRVNFTNMNIIKSWTKSALEEQKCERNLSTNNNVTEVERNCSSTCLLAPDLIFIMFSDDNKTCCLRNSSSHILQSEDCTIRNLSIVNGMTESETPRFCLAAEVIDGSLYISIEDCGRFFKAFNVSRNMVRPPTPPPPPPKTRTPTTTRENTSSRQSSGQRITKVKTVKTVKTTAVMNTQTDIPVSFETITIAVAISLSLFAIVCIVFGIVFCRKFKQSGRNREQQRPNSVTNRAYSTEGFHHLHQDDEEYTLISDMEVEPQSPESYKPPVPDRGSNTSKDKGTKEIEIITLAEYSLPSDNVRVGYKISQTSDYCMTTYDDPIRYKLKEAHENKGESGCIENCLAGGNEPQSNRRGSKTNSGELDRNSRNSQMSASRHSSATTDLRIDTQSAAVLPGAEIANDRSETIEPENETHTKQDVDNYEVSVTETEQKQRSEIIDNLGNPEFLLGDTDTSVDKDSGDDSDYEDPNIIDGKFPKKCSSKSMFEEHVCLDCLKPEHLTKLGIKIISDDMYEKSKSLKRSVSDPPAQVYYNTVEIGSGEFSKTTDEGKLEDQTEESDRVRHEEDTLTELDVVRRKKTAASAKRCSVCHTVYDRLGDTKINPWANYTDNVYDQFGNFKHFKHRRQISGKRMNST